MKTLLEIARELGVDKQRVYRCVVRNHIPASSEVGQVRYYDDAAEAEIKALLSRVPDQTPRQDEAHRGNGEAPRGDAVLDLLREELKAKNEQISALQQQISQLTSALENTTASLHAAQALHAGTIQQQLGSSAASQAADREQPAEEVSADPIDQQPRKPSFRERWRAFWFN